jgi:hypothetical protein
MKLVSKYGYLYFIYLEKYKGNSAFRCLKPGITDQSDIEERLDKHRKDHKCNPLVFLAIKTLSTTYYERIIINKIFEPKFKKIGKTREYFIYNEPIDLELMEQITNRIKRTCGLSDQQYNIEKKTCIYIDHFCKIDLRLPITTEESYYDIETIIEHNDWSIPMCCNKPEK